MFIAVDVVVAWFSSTMDWQRHIDMPARIQITHMDFRQPHGVGFGRRCSCAVRQYARSAVVFTRATMPSMGVALFNFLHLNSWNKYIFDVLGA